MEQEHRVYLLHRLDVSSSVDGDHVILTTRYRTPPPKVALGAHQDDTEAAGDGLMLRAVGVEHLYLGLRRSLLAHHPDRLPELDKHAADTLHGEAPSLGREGNT